jgi:DNA-binding MarR family transcriptional regulator
LTYVKVAGTDNFIVHGDFWSKGHRQPGPDLLERRQDPHDPRIMAVNLTQKGRALLARSLAAVEE